MPELRSAQLRDVGTKAQELAKLKEHPAWDLLRREFELRKQAHLQKIVRDLMAGGPDAAPMSQREIDYQRGFLRGAQAVLDTPDNAIAQLEKLLGKEQS